MITANFEIIYNDIEYNGVQDFGPESANTTTLLNAIKDVLTANVDGGKAELIRRRKVDGTKTCSLRIFDIVDGSSAETTYPTKTEINSFITGLTPLLNAISTLTVDAAKSTVLSFTDTIAVGSATLNTNSDYLNIRCTDVTLGTGQDWWNNNSTSAESELTDWANGIAAGDANFACEGVRLARERVGGATPTFKVHCEAVGVTYGGSALPSKANTQTSLTLLNDQIEAANGGTVTSNLLDSKSAGV